MPRSIFITGFPGFIAGQLVRRFVRETGTTVRLLVFPAMRQAAEEARAALGPEAERTEIVEGDITRGALGLDSEARRRLQDEVDTVYHLAAVYDLAAPHAIARLVNLTGTEHVLDFCESLPRLQRLVYFSTAYVLGTRTGRVLEGDLEETKAWKNYYEMTKWEAEVAVRRRWERIPTVVIRPGVVVGDSRTGEINKYDGPYFVIRNFVDLERRGRVRMSRYFWSATPSTPFPMVPVDFICDATELLAARADTAGKAYHVLPNPAPTMKEMGDAIFASFGVRPPRFNLPTPVARTALKLLPPLRRSMRFPIELFDYLRNPVYYDTANLDAALRGSSLRCPTAAELIPVMVDYVRQHPEVAVNFGATASSRVDRATTAG